MACGYEQVLFRGPIAKTIAVKNRERVWKNEGEQTEMVETKTRNKYLAVGEACIAVF